MGLEELKILEKYVNHKTEVKVNKNSGKINVSPNPNLNILQTLTIFNLENDSLGFE